MSDLITIAVAALAGAALVGVLALRLGVRIVRDGARSRLGAVGTTGAPEPNPTRHRVLRLVDAVERRRAQQALCDVDAAPVAALLDRTARHCASGQSLSQAFTESLVGSPAAPLFEPAAHAIAAGASVDDALDRQVGGHPHVVLAVHALRLCARQGGNLSESLDRAAATLRDRSTAARERHAQSAQARLSGRVLTVLPIGFGGWTLVSTPTVRAFVATPPGLACIAAGLGLNALGWLAMSRVVRRTW